MASPAISRPVLRVFRRIVRGYFRRHFHAVRLSVSGGAGAVRGPLIVIGNHSSWWDPMVVFLAGELIWPERDHFAPMDAAALERYRVLARVGVFPVEQSSARGAVQFLRTGEAVLAEGGVLWVTPQGRFADVREQPIEFRPGVAALARRVAERHGECAVVPLAIEYTFWDERMPECLVRVGEAVRVGAGEAVDEVDARLRTALAGEMAELAGLAMGRNPRPFRTVLRGRAGVGGFYGTMKRTVAALMGRRYVADHTVHEDSATGQALDDRGAAELRPAGRSRAE